MNHPVARPPDIAQLRSACAVLREGNVTRAAEKVGLTQPAVSRLVAALEADLGFALFHRERRRLVPTEEGQTFLREAEVTLGGLLRLGELGRELKQGSSGFLRVGSVSALAYGLAPRILAELLQEHPGLSVDVEELDLTEQVAGLLSHHLDVGLVALPFGATGLQVDVVVEADAVCLMPSGHPLASRTSVNPECLASERFVRLRESRMLQRMTEDAFTNAGLRRQVSLTVDSTPLMVAFVAGGLGLAITHSMSALVLPNGVISRPFAPRLTFGYAALSRADIGPNRTIRRFIELARATAIAAVDQVADDSAVSDPA